MTGWKNERYDQLIDKAHMTKDNKERFLFYQEAETILMKEMPIIPIYLYVQENLVAKNLKMLNVKGEIVEWNSNYLNKMLLKYFILVK
jgi:ABC-type oligopeptide transport system substrate-binding subunit